VTEDERRRAIAACIAFEWERILNNKPGVCPPGTFSENERAVMRLLAVEVPPPDPRRN
jgi:hypothetical protein